MSDEHLWKRFSPRERGHLKMMKKRQRVDILSFISRSQERPVADDVPLRLRVLQSDLPDSVKLKIFEELHHGDGTEKYVSWVLKAIQLPLKTLHKPAMYDLRNRLVRARHIMDDAMTGQQELKLEVLQLMCATAGRRAYSLGLEGAPGCGKTHFVKNALAPALGRPIACIPLGGASDGSLLLGSDYTYMGSKPGRVVEALMETRCRNPIVYFDEVDKIAKTERGAEIEAILIHLIDPSSPTLRDRYFHGIDIDFSDCTFVFSFNCAETVNPVLLDRIKRVPVSSPTAEERRQIVVDHVVPRASQQHDMPVVLSDAALEYVLQGTCPDGGMREVEKRVDHVVSRLHLTVADGGVCPESVFDADGRVSGAFAAQTLQSMHGSKRARSPPPSMYV